MDSSLESPSTLSPQTTDTFSGDSAGLVNLSYVTVYVTPDEFLIEPSNAAPMRTQLLIDKKTGKPSEIRFDERQDIKESFEFKEKYSAFLGIISIQDRAFLILVDQVQQACVIDSNEVHSICQASFIPFENDRDFFRTDKGSEIISLMLNIRKLLTQGFYFSYNYDITLPKSRRSEEVSVDSTFMWNHNLYRDLVNYNIDKRWQLPIIQGFISQFNVRIDKKDLRYILISKRSWLKAGTRTHTRGIDDEGNVANFVETEQIIYYNGFCCSHVQIRGNPPAFFQQTTLNSSSQIKITRNADLTYNAFLKHMYNLESTYGYALCINLMNNTKKEEQIITTIYESLLRHANLSKIRYEFFDYTNSTKSHKFEKVNMLIQKIKPLIENMNFYAEDEATKTVKITQKGVIRTCCLDSLDRTNIIQSKIAIAVFGYQMRQLGVDLTTEFTQDPILQVDSDSAKQQHPFFLAFKDIWGDNGDTISMQYAGMLSGLSVASKNTKKGLFGLLDYGMKSINILNLGPLEDSLKQEGISLLLGHQDESISVTTEAIKEALKNNEKEFSTYGTINVYIITWNVGNFVPTSTFDASQMFDFEGFAAPDIIAVGLQEHIQLNASNVVAGMGEPLDFLWNDIITEQLKQYGHYIFVQKETLVGILLIIFIKIDIKDRISNLEIDTVKTGLAGTLGNKGAVVIKFNVDDSSLCFLNCHMEAGGKNNNVRLMNITDFHQKAFQQGGPGRKSEEKIQNIDYKFLFGDTNFRINQNSLDIKTLIERYKMLKADPNSQTEAEDILKYLISQDQLTQSKYTTEVLERYREGTISFLPTYKYDPNTDVYDTSKKQRTPSWTDRILWRCDAGEVEQAFYSRREYQNSDHRPVVSYFTIKVKKVDRIKKNSVVKGVFQSLLK